MKRILFFLLLRASCVSAQSSYNLIGDKALSSATGSENLVTIQKCFYSFEDQYLKPSLSNEEKWYKKITGIGYRASKTILLDYPTDYILYLIQHEVYGHGAKMREYTIINNSYNINLPFPYGKGGGFAKYGQFKNNKYRIITLQEDEAVYYSGVEANALLSKSLLYKWLDKGTINYRESIFYFKNFHALTNYLFKTKDENSQSSNDVLYYLYYLNGDNGYFNPKENPFRLEHLKKLAIINFLDPFQYLATYTYLKTYLWEGKSSSALPMIPIGNIRYLPSFHLGLTPFGAELYFENYLVNKKNVWTLYYRYGEPTFNKFWGMGGKWNNLVNNKRLNISIDFDGWNQPSLELGGDTITKTKGGIGGALSARCVIKINNTFGIYSQIGYKTPGHLIGESLNKGPILRLGLSFQEKIEN